MAKKDEKEPNLMSKIGPWAFILGLVIAVLSAVSGTLFWFLGLLGLVVGLMNVTDKEMNTFMLATLVFIVSANALSTTLTKLVSLLPVVGSWLNFVDPLLANVTLFVAPGAAVVALKALYNLSKD